jgi:NitT/TauT family transport system substrate-binding protein
MSTANVEPGYEISRRNFLGNALALTASSFYGVSPAAAADAPLETKKIRLVLDPSICQAPQFLSEELLRLEGFEEVEYVLFNYQEYPNPGGLVGAGKADLTQDAGISFVYMADRGQPIVVLSGVHVGCWELFGGSRVRAIRDLKGKRIPIGATGSEEHLKASSMLAYLGMDPRKDVEFVRIKFEDQLAAFVDGTVDAIFAFPPQPQRLRAEKIGHVIVDAARDRPWNQYFCCMVAANRDFATRNPVATKRALRAMLKASDICAQDPQRAARYLVAKGYEPRYETALEVLTSVAYGRWRDLNPEDTLRFHALRLREVGMIKSDPKKLIAQSTDWRFLNELKKELKA